MEAALLDLLRIKRGHFQFESGHHGNLWLDLDSLFLRPRLLLPFLQELARRLCPYRIEAVVGPLVGGALVAQMIAAEIGTLFAFAERAIDASAVRYRIPDAFRHRLAGKRVAIVDDAINAGSATRATYGELTSCGAHPVAIGSLLLLGTAALPFFEAQGLPIERIASLPNDLWESAHCPLCAAGQPLNNPPAGP
jgi:orotate phosphoribosyltransferase